MSTLYIVRGLPGAGKTSFAKILSWNLECEFFEADMWFDKYNGGVFDHTKLSIAHTWCCDQVKYELAQRSNVIVSNTFTTEKEISVYTDLAALHGAKVVSIIVENRHGNKSVHNVPEATIDKMRNRFSIKL